MIKAVLIDMDNTLIETQAIYERAHAKAARLISALGGCAELEAFKALAQSQITLYPTMGYAPERMPTGYEQVLRHFVPEPAAEDVAEVRAIASEVFSTVAALVPGAEDAIRRLAAQYDLCLLTVGDANVQQNRVDALPFKNIFKEIFIVPVKDEAVYDSVLKTLGRTPDECVMIGDSLRSDIIPAIEAGLHAIFVPGHGWSMETAGIQLPAKASVCENLGAAADSVLGPKKNAAPKRKPPAPGI